MVKVERMCAAAHRAGYWCILCHIGPEGRGGVMATHFATLDGGEPVPVCGKHMEDIEAALKALEKKGLLE